MVKPSSDFMIPRSFSWLALVSSSTSSFVISASPPVSSTIVPLVPAFGEPGAGWVAVDEEEENASEDVVVVAVREELGNAVEGDDPADRLENNP